LLNPKTILQFEAFIEEAKRLSLAQNQPSAVATEPEVLARFQSFIEEATPLAVQTIRETLRANQTRLEKLCRWIVPESCDILTVSGLRGDEDPYTNLIAWMLFPSDPKIALICQRAWLEAIGLSSLAKAITGPTEPKTQFVTDDGRPDLVMHFRKPDFVLIVEAKTATEEHATPNSQWQTEGYPAAVRRKLCLSADHPGAMIFLTPDGREAASADAIVTTYEVLVTAIAESLSPEELSPHLRSAYAQVITNVLTHAAHGGSNRALALQKLNQYLSDEVDSLSDAKIIENLGTLGALCQSLNSRNSR